MEMQPRDCQAVGRGVPNQEFRNVETQSLPTFEGDEKDARGCVLRLTVQGYQYNTA